jgi:hypothetical protein
LYLLLAFLSVLTFCLPFFLSAPSACSLKTLFCLQLLLAILALRSC